MPVPPGTIVHLTCESDHASYDQAIRAIVVERETDTAWFGRPADRPDCPTLEWPKFAWTAVPG